jgi:hypothetical protein
MKTMTCKQLGGACDEKFRAATFKDMTNMSRNHRMKMAQQQDIPHLEAMDAMRDLMKTSKLMQEWMIEKQAVFDALPEE